VVAAGTARHRSTTSGCLPVPPRADVVQHQVQSDTRHSLQQQQAHNSKCQKQGATTPFEMPAAVALWLWTPVAG